MHYWKITDQIAGMHFPAILMFSVKFQSSIFRRGDPLTPPVTQTYVSGNRTRIRLVKVSRLRYYCHRRATWLEFDQFQMIT